MGKAVVATIAVCYLAGIWAPPAAAQAPIPTGPSKQNQRVIKHDDHPTPGPSPGKAMVYVTIGGYFGKAAQGKIAVNGEYRAIVEKNQYAFFEVDPGVLGFHLEGAWASDKHDVYLMITAMPNETYYVVADKRSIQEVDVEEGRSLIAKRDYVTFEVKE